MRVSTTGNPFRSPSGQLPYLQTADGQRIAGYTQIVDHLRAEGFALNSHSYLGQRHSLAGRADAYEMLLSEQLYAAIQYQLWGVPAAADQTRLLYAKRTPFPFSFWYPQVGRYRKTPYNYSIC